MPERAWLEFGSLATIAEIWLDQRLVAHSDNMFVPLTVAVPSGGAQRLEICFRALRPLLRRRLPGRRPRWRSRLTTEEGLRGYRTTMLGHMPGWSGDKPVIGPVRPIVLHQPVRDAPLIARVDLHARLLPDGTGVITVELLGTGLTDRPGTVSALGQKVDLTTGETSARAEIHCPDPPRWWPHTHGEPHTCPVVAMIAGQQIHLGHVGFRTIERRDPTDGFGLIINGAPVFCRGAIWTGLDPSGLPTPRPALKASLNLARQAGLNMLRVTGLTHYENTEFFACCDALGIMVWHDFMFTRFDYPDNDEFLASSQSEARAFLNEVSAHPSLTVLCGGSEIAQAAAMSGCPPTAWHTPLLDKLLAVEAAAACPDVPYVSQSPLSGPGDMAVPFAASAAISHYFGVGAYQRPLHELSSSGIRFAAECLAFSNPPAPASCRIDTQNVSKSAPRDIGSDWDFADVRDHYVDELFGHAVLKLRRQDSALWLSYGRATVALIMQQALATWRTDRSCAGALLLMLQDLIPGAGWGLIGHDGRPKSAFYALQSVCQPVQILLRDLGQNEIVIHTINEIDEPRHVRLGLRGLSPSGTAEELGVTTIALGPRANQEITATALIGRWRDLTNAWQFGTHSFHVLGATLDDAETGDRLSACELFPAGAALPRTHPNLTASLDRTNSTLAVSTQYFAQFVEIDDDNCVPADNYFHLWPGETRVVALRALAGRATIPGGVVSALNAYAPIHYGRAA